MKTKNIFQIALVAVILSASFNSFGQVTRIDTLPEIVITAKSVVSAKVTDAFKGKFKNAINPRWYSMDKNYLVKFITKDQKNSALYDKKGDLIYHLTYGGEKHLPAQTLSLLRDQYRTLKVVSAIHVDQSQRSIWVVNMEVGKDLVLARVEDDQVEEVERQTNATVK
jgi:hypothetical protein